MPAMTVLAADDSKRSPGNHSEYLERHSSTARPRDETVGFIAERRADLHGERSRRVVPAFEEAFYIATQGERLSKATRVFAPAFAKIARLHDKIDLPGASVSSSGSRSPGTMVATKREELRGRDLAFARSSAAPAFSRGGVELLTNTGPLAGAMAIADCEPTPESSWLVGEFVDGRRCARTRPSTRGGSASTDVPDPAPVAPLHGDRLSVDRRRAGRWS